MRKCLLGVVSNMFEGGIVDVLTESGELLKYVGEGDVRLFEASAGEGEGVEEEIVYPRAGDLAIDKYRMDGLTPLCFIESVSADGRVDVIYEDGERMKSMDKDSYRMVNPVPVVLYDEEYESSGRPEVGDMVLLDGDRMVSGRYPVGVVTRVERDEDDASGPSMLDVVYEDGELKEGVLEGYVRVLVPVSRHISEEGALELDVGNLAVGRE